MRRLRQLGVEAENAINFKTELQRQLARAADTIATLEEQARLEAKRRTEAERRVGN